MDTKKLDQQKADIKPSIWDSDGRIYLAKYYRTQLTTGPAAFLSVLAMVSSLPWAEKILADPIIVACRESEDQDAIVSFAHPIAGSGQS